MVAVSPAFSWLTLLVIARVGAVVSITMALLAPSEPAAPGTGSVRSAGAELVSRISPVRALSPA